MVYGRARRDNGKDEAEAVKGAEHSVAAQILIAVRHRTAALVVRERRTVNEAHRTEKEAREDDKSDGIADD